jgi:hypothetical protein
METQQGGSTANKTGNELEVFIQARLERGGYLFVSSATFRNSQYGRINIVSRDVSLPGCHLRVGYLK